MSLRNENSQANQTEFVDQAPFLDNKSSRIFSLGEIKKNKNLRPFYILSFSFVLLVAIFFLIITSRKQQVEEQVLNEVEENSALDPLSQRAYELREDLKDHDPTKQSLPFPQVDLEFNIN